MRPQTNQADSLKTYITTLYDATLLEAGADLLAVLGSVQAGTVGDMVALVQDGATVGGVLV